MIVLLPDAIDKCWIDVVESPRFGIDKKVNNDNDRIESMDKNIPVTVVSIIEGAPINN